MRPGPVRDLLTIVLGLVTGAMSAAFGIGGAVVSTPGIRLLGATTFEAVGTTLPSILPSAASGTVRYVREGLVEWRVVRWAAPPGVVAAVAGSLGSHAVPGGGHWLMVLTAVILGVTAFSMARGGRPDEDGDAGGRRPRRFSRLAGGRPRLAAVTIGATAGGLSGLLGVGGGAVLVPGFSEVVGLSVASAVATSLACVGILAVPSTVAHAILGDIDWRFALLLTVAVVPGARLGAAFSVWAGERRLRRLVAVVLGTIAVAYGVGELLAL